MDKLKESHDYDVTQTVLADLWIRENVTSDTGTLDKRQVVRGCHQCGYDQDC